MQSQSVSLLMFNRNENEGIIRSVRLLHNAVDEIVIIDSSDPEKGEQLKESLKSFNVKIYRALTLGYADPLYYYGISKTSSDYILKLDADEEPSKELIKKIEERNFLYSVYNIHWKTEASYSLGYKPIVLFTKNSIKKITGIIHTAIEYKYTAKNFPKDAYMIHHDKPRSNIRKNYIEIESYERPVQLYLENLKKRRKVLGNFLSLAFDLPKPVNFYLTAFLTSFGGAAINMLENCSDLKNCSDLISTIHLNSFWFNYEIAKMKYFYDLSKSEQKLRLKIAREIYECGGIIPYLGLNKTAYIENLTKTFKFDMPGIEAFKKLVLYRHFHKKAAYDFPYKE